MENEPAKSNNGFSKTLEWAKSKNDEKNIFKEFYSDEIFKIAKPKGIGAPMWVSEYHYRKPYIAVIEKGRICSNECLIITPDNKLLIDLVHPSYWENFDPHKLPPSTYYDGVIAILAYGNYQDNYYHWLIDIIPRIHLIQKSGIKVDKYVLRKLRYSFQYETLRKLRIPIEKIWQIDNKNFNITSKKLMVSSIPINLGGCTKWACEFVRKTFLPSEKINGFERIYISREDAKYRKVHNEDAVMGVLTRKGFKKIVLGSLSFQQQLDIFSSAKIIVSPNGAGLSNLIFCQPGSKIIELFTDTAEVFLKISSFMKLDHYYLRCKAVNRVVETRFKDDLNVDIEGLKKVLEIIKI